MKVVIGPNFYGLQVVFDEVKPKYPEVIFEHCPDNENLASSIVDADVFMGWIPREIFLKAEKLQWIQSPSSGVDKFIAVPELKNGKVLLTSAVGTHGHVLADHAMGMILSFTRCLNQLLLKQQEKEWFSKIRPQCRELRGLTMGIVGFGASGQQVAQRAAAFGMRILAVDVEDKKKPDYVEHIGKSEEMDAIIGKSDVVVVASPYTPKNKALVGEKQISLMKKDTLLIGISRGGVIDQTAVLKALQNGRIAGAGLDVFEEEPLPADDPLWDQKNLIITPHSAGGTQYEIENINNIFKENLEKFLKGDFSLRNLVDKERGW